MRTLIMESISPSFPARKALEEFFQLDRRQSVGVAFLAQLLGATDEQVRRVLLSDGLGEQLDSLEWADAAGYVFDAWPHAQLLAALSRDVRRSIPSAFHPIRVPWRIPAFIVRAMKHQAVLMRQNDPRVDPAGPNVCFASPSLEDYIADVLLSGIHWPTVAALANDAAFLEAYQYPWTE